VELLSEAKVAMPTKKTALVAQTAIAASPAYAEFLSSLDVVTIAMVASSFSIDRQAYFEARQRQLNVSWEPRITMAEEDFFEIRADVVVKLSDGKKRAFFNLAASYELHIHAPAPMNPDFVNRFAESDVRVLIWPYVREYVSGVSGRMHVPPVILPLTGSKHR
jgi:hypothetical protein